jgi:hypothetical protein
LIPGPTVTVWMEEDLLEIYLKPRRNIRGFTIPEAIMAL